MGYGICFSFLDARNWRRTPFSAALGVSLLVHALALALLPGFPKTAQPALRTLNATLRPPPAPALAAPQAPAAEVSPQAPDPAAAPRGGLQRTRKPAVPPVLAAKPRADDGGRVPSVPPGPSPRSDPAQDTQAPALPSPAVEAPMMGPVREAAAAAVGAARPDLAALTAYGEALARAIGRQQRYPRIALMRQWQGTTVLDLAVDAEGRLLDVRIVRSSGHEVLDQSAVEMARAAIPLPRPPAPLVAPGLSLHVPVVFKLVQ